MSVTYGCISCLETDNVFNIYDTHECEGVEEIYVSMLKICFDVTIPENPSISYMCENCILILRQAYYFKQRVLKNLQVLETALTSQIEEDETPNNFDTKVQLEEELDPETGQMTMIVTEKAEFDEQVWNVEISEFEVIGTIKEEDLVTTSNIEETKEELDNVSHPVNNDTKLVQDTHFECGDCGKKFLTKINIARHAKTHLSGTFPCNICGQVFSKLNTRNSHQWRVHNAREPYACARCDLRFLTFHQRLRHLEEAHGQREQYPCPYCDHVYPYAGARSVHIRQKHLRVHRHPCSECKMGFFKRRDLLSHLASVHDIGEKKHVCPICQKSFYRFSILRNHIKLHSKKEKFEVCHICQAQFTHKKTLKNHMKHHELQPQDTSYIIY